MRKRGTSRWSAWRAVLPLLALLLAGCAGPRAPLNVGIKEVPGDVVLGGAKPQIKYVPIPPISLPVTPPGVSEFILPVDREPLPSPQACPSADPLQAPARQAVNTIAAPPPAGVYLFRNDGTFELTGPNAVRGTFPEISTRVVKNIFKFTEPGTSQPAWFRFDVEASLVPVATTSTTYTLVPEHDGPGLPAGLYISRVRTAFSDGTKEDFKPANLPGLLLVPFPASEGKTWEAAGADPRSGMAMAFTGRVGSKARVDACGVPLDAVVIHIDGDFGPSDGSGVVVSPGAQTRFVADYAIGTQFGGLSLMDTVEVDREFPAGSLHHKNHATIGSQPGLPSADVPPCEGECLVP